MLTHSEIVAAIPDVLTRVDLDGLGERLQGKVRDCYVSDQRRVLITTDRVSAFDRVLGAIPFKGQVLNQLSAWWFDQLADVVGSHVIDIPDPNVTVAMNAQPLPVEVVVRGYITGVTSTSLWMLYKSGVERPYGLDLPRGLQKNDTLSTPVITPTTKATGGAHDERLTSQQVVDDNLVDADLWRRVQDVALELFQRGQAVARDAGLLLVDTKYEFGLIDGELTLIDEVHTPDSSRYWIADSYEQSRSTGDDPEHFDKEFLRLWFVERGYRGEGVIPQMPDDFIAQVSLRYITAYEKLTGLLFEPGAQPADERIKTALTTTA